VLLNQFCSGARSLLAEARIERKFWPECISTPAYLTNRSLANTAECETCEKVLVKLVIKVACIFRSRWRFSSPRWDVPRADRGSAAGLSPRHPRLVKRKMEVLYRKTVYTATQVYMISGKSAKHQKLIALLTPRMQNAIHRIRWIKRNFCTSSPWKAFRNTMFREIRRSNTWPERLGWKISRRASCASRRRYWCKHEKIYIPLPNLLLSSQFCQIESKRFIMECSPFYHQPSSLYKIESSRGMSTFVLQCDVFTLKEYDPIPNPIPQKCGMNSFLHSLIHLTITRSPILYKNSKYLISFSSIKNMLIEYVYSSKFENSLLFFIEPRIPPLEPVVPRNEPRLS